MSGIKGGVWWAWRLWYLLHAIFSCSLILRALFRRCSRFSGFTPNPASNKTPNSVAVVIDSDSARVERNNVAELLLWLAAAGVRHVTLYDVEGVLKSSRSYLKERVLSDHKRSFGFSFNPSSSHDALFVELLSVHDGKAAIAEAAQHSLEKLKFLPQAEQLQRLEEFSELDITNYLDETQQPRPDPELMLVFGNRNSVQSFPPWRLRLTEIVHLGHLKNLKHSSLVSVMHIYSGKTQRYGR